MKLAINGGTPVRKDLFPAYQTIGAEEKAAVNRVLSSGTLSKFLGCWDPDFYGGTEVQALEREWAEYFGVRHAIAVNSCTSGLYCAVGSLGIEPGDEIIVSPYTMSASTTAALIYGAIPVFADVEPEHFCLSVESVRRCLSERTRAIIAVDLFGQPYDADGINALANEHNISVIEDAAQAPGAHYRGHPTGTLGDVGVFSLNYHKHIHTGEGGVVTTDDGEIAEKVRLIRNHAEAVIGDKGSTDLVNMVGFNYRMTELEAAIGRCQLQKLEDLLVGRIANCVRISQALADVPAIVPSLPREDSRHVYYVQAMRFLSAKAGVGRDVFLDAVRAELAPSRNRESEGPLVFGGYVAPLYLLPMYQKRIAFGSRGYPFNLARKEVSYARGSCPITEQLHFQELFYHDLIHPNLSDGDLDDVVDAFQKVWRYRAEIR